MSKDGSSSRPIHRKISQSLANENKYESSWNQIPLIPPRTPLNSIPDPSQYQLETRLQHFQHDVREKPESPKPSNSRKPEGISEAQHVSSVLRTPKGHCRGKSTNLELHSAQSTPVRTAPRVSNAIAASGLTFSRLQSQLDNGGGRGGISRRVSGGVSIAFAQQLLADVPHFELVDDPSFWNDHNVQVLIRIRPLNSAEMISQGYGRCLRQESAQTVVWLGHPETRFTFDHIACESVSQEKLFQVAGLPMVDNCMSGYNSCMFAYGQTGSGKTYTMMGEINKMDGRLSDNSGITPRIFEYLFTKITKEEESRKHERLTYSCKCSFLEIYNEHITDLLEPSSTNLQLREDLKKGIYVENLTECSVRTVNDVLKLLQQGAANRKIAATHMNSESSRSHSVFTCVIESRWEKDSISHLRFGRLNLVDLAGSERQKGSGAEGDRLKEAANINKSLSTLGLVIMSLVDLAQGKHRHVPYRDSKLTFLLQDSLGGNSKTTIIANVSPSICSANETLGTLKFAQRAKLIQNNAKINEDASAGVIALQQQIQQLKDQLSFLMKHQHTSMELNFVPRPEQSSLVYFSECYEPPEDINMHGRHKTPKESITTKLAETEARRLKAEIEHLNNLAHQREKEVQHAKMMLRFREERIKRLELLLDGLISADQFYLDENNALREENLILQTKLERNSEVIRCQGFCEQGERDALLAEILELRNQVSKSLEVEKGYAHHQFFPMEEEQEPNVAKELVQCKDMNSKLIREVDELRLQLANRMNSNQETSNSIDNVLLRSDSVDEVTSNNLLSNEVIYDENNEKMKYMLDFRCDNVHKQLLDAESLVETMKQEQLQLIRELKSSQRKNQGLMKLLDANEVTQRVLEVQNEDCKREQPHSANQRLTVSIEVSEGSTIEALQAKLEKLSEDLKEAQALNRQYIDDHATRLSEDLQIESIRDEVELETTRTIMQLQEEIDTLKSEFQVCLCSMAEQNLSLSKSVAAKDNELRILGAEWERAALELTTFLIDGSRSLGDASRQIKSISSSFPNVNDWISEHVERAAKICIEKEETILLLQKSLGDAQNTVAQMEQKLYSLKGAAIALTEFQKPESEEFQLSGNAAEAKKFLVNNSMSNKSQFIDNQDNAPTLVENRMSDYSTSTLSDTVFENLPLAHTTAFTSTDDGIQFNLAGVILPEIEDAITRTCADAEIYLFALNSDFHNAISLYKGMIQDLLKDVSNMRNDIKELKGNPGNLQTFNDVIPVCSVLNHENQQQILQQIRNKLLEVNNRLSSMSACFYKAMTMNCYMNSNGSFTETDGWATDCSCSCSYASVETVDNDVKPSSTDRHQCTSKTTEQTLDLNFDEGSNLGDKRAVLLLREFMKVNEAFVKLKEHLVAFAISKINQDCVDDILSISDLHALETLKVQCGDEHDQPTSKRAAAGTKSFGELVVEEKHNPTNSFFAKFEEAYATIEEADYMLKAMLKANENASTLTAKWKETGEELMADKARLSEEIQQLKSFALLRDGDEEILQDDIKFRLAEEANVLSSLEECSLAMQTCVEELFETAHNDAIQVVEEMQSIFCSLRSSSEDIMCKAMQNDISIFVLQCQTGEYYNMLRRLHILSTSDRSTLLEHCPGADNSEISCAGRDDGSALHPVKCESSEYQVACVPSKENKVLDLVPGDPVGKNSELQRELKRKDFLLKGLLLDFSLLQEFASHRKDVKDELEKLIVTMSEVQHELQIKRVELDDMLVQNNKLERCLFEAKQALFNSNSELDQAKGALDSLSEQNNELKDLLKDVYLKNSEAEQLQEDQRDTIKSLEREIIRISSSSEKQLVPSLEDIEDALTEVTAERDHLVEKLNSLQDKLDIITSLADENQAIAAEAHQESEASKLYAEQKEEEVKILECSVEELDGTINVLEKKVHEMEEEVEKQRLIRDSLELELQSLRHRLLTVEDLTESMTSENTNAAPLEDQLARKLHVRSLEINEAQSRIKFLEEENARQAKEIRQFKDYISELVLHAEAQASLYQQKYKSLEAMLHEVKTDSSNVSAVPTLERVDKISARTRGSSSPFRCIVGLVQQMNQEKDPELSSARLRIEELEALAASRYKEVCMLNTRLATAESMTHDVIRDLLGVKLEISNYANIVDQHQIEKLIKEAHHHRQEFVTMEQDIVKLRSQIDDLLEERERCIEEINRNKADQLATQIVVEQLQEREHLLHAQNQMLKMDKSNLQKRITELDDMVKKPFSINQPQTNSLLRPIDYDLGKRLAHSQKVLSRINNQLAQYRRPDGSSFPDDKKERHSDQRKFREQKP